MIRCPTTRDKDGVLKLYRKSQCVARVRTRVTATSLQSSTWAFVKDKLKKLTNLNFFSFYMYAKTCYNIYNFSCFKICPVPPLTFTTLCNNHYENVPEPSLPSSNSCTCSAVSSCLREGFYCYEETPWHGNSYKEKHLIGAGLQFRGSLRYCHGGKPWQPAPALTTAALGSS